jgi:hypothetical protein
VKIEGQNADRHLDAMLHNEQCSPANTPPMVYVDESAFGDDDNKDCAKDKKAMEDACKDQDPCPGVLGITKSKQLALFGGDRKKAANAAEAEAKKNKCVEKSRCYLRPYIPGATKDGCCPGQTGHHIPPKACFKGPTGRYMGNYSSRSALVVCMEGMSQHFGSHGKNHAAIEWLAKQKGIKEGQWCDAKDYNMMCAQTVEAQCGCKKECIAAQLNEQSDHNGVKNIRHVSSHSSSGVTNEMKDDIGRIAGLPQTTFSG